MRSYDRRLKHLEESWKQFELEESINDQNIFKAIFLVGSGGSGKSYISKKIFGNDAKVVNSDDLFEFLLVKNKMDKIINSSAPDYEKKMELRNKAKELTQKRHLLYVNGFLPIIIDGTGSRYEETMSQRQFLENMGYDTHMVFVNTSLETALERNRRRERQVPEEAIEQAWYAVQENLGGYQEEFSDRMFIVNNNDNDVLSAKRINHIYNSIFDNHIRNPKGREIVQTLKKTGGKYYTDYIAHKMENENER